MERVQKIIAASGFCSRRKAEEYIKKGLVQVNGQVIGLGDKAEANDKITIDGKRISRPEAYVYYLLNKPRGYISTVSDDKDRPVVIDLIDSKKRIYPVGRLDYNTTGALLLTNDGAATEKLTHPRYGVWKSYIATIKGQISVESLNKLRDGVKINGSYKTAKAKVRVVKFDPKANKTTLKIVIHEGKNHQIKEMLWAVGFLVGKLHRESFGDLTVRKLAPGKYQEIDSVVIKQMLRRK